MGTGPIHTNLDPLEELVEDIVKAAFRTAVFMFGMQLAWCCTGAAPLWSHLLIVLAYTACEALGVAYWHSKR